MLKGKEATLMTAPAKPMSAPAKPMSVPAKQRPIVTYVHLEAERDRLVGRLQNLSGLEKRIVQNIVAYAKCLVKPGTKVIDELIFTSQMVQHFGITDKILLGRMYFVFKDVNLAHLTFNEYSRLICTMLSPKLEVLAAYTFSVYDINNDGNIDTTELYQLLKTCEVSSESDDMDRDESVRELVDVVMNTAQFNRTSNLNRDQYMQLVRKDILQLQIFGKCLPDAPTANAFLQILTGPTAVEIQRMFRHERQRSLNDIDPPPKSPLYPFYLELP